jgi:CHAT domain-containing protein
LWICLLAPPGAATAQVDIGPPAQYRVTVLPPDRSPLRPEEEAAFRALRGISSAAASEPSAEAAAIVSALSREEFQYYGANAFFSERDLRYAARLAWIGSLIAKEWSMALADQLVLSRLASLDDKSVQETYVRGLLNLGARDGLGPLVGLLDRRSQRMTPTYDPGYAHEQVRMGRLLLDAGLLDRAEARLDHYVRVFGDPDAPSRPSESYWIMSDQAIAERGLGEIALERKAYSTAADRLRRGCEIERRNSGGELGVIDRARALSVADYERRTALSAYADCGHMLGEALVGSRGRTGPVAPQLDPLGAEAFQVAQRSSLSDPSSAPGAEAAILAADRAGVGPDARAYELAMAEMVNKQFGLYSGLLAMDDRLRSRMRRLETGILDHAATVHAGLPDYWSRRHDQVIGPATLQARSGQDANLLRSDEALVFWVVAPGRRKGLVFAVTKDRAAWAEIPLTGDQIAAEVRRLRSQIDPCGFGLGGTDCAARGLAIDLQAAWRLHEALLGDPGIRSVIRPASIRTLLIVPSGPLNALPPGILITEKPPEGCDRSPECWREARWLLREKAVAVLPSVQTLRAMRVELPRSLTDGREREPLFMLADPDFAGSADPTSSSRTCPLGERAWIGRAAGIFKDAPSLRLALSQLPRLPCTRREASELQRLLGGVVLTGREAREQRLRTAAGAVSRARVLAIATHGLVSGDLGLTEPGLALAPPLPSEPAEDGILGASEILGMRLSADWVLLTACNTASPDSPAAPGLSGLSRAFLYAGARSVLVSHWRVDDATTAAVVAATVRRWSAGASKAEALRAASIDVLDGRLGAADEVSAHPAFWAAFTLIGDPL